MKKILIIFIIIIGGIFMFEKNIDNSNLSLEEEIILNRYKELEQENIKLPLKKMFLIYLVMK